MNTNVIAEGLIALAYAAIAGWLFLVSYKTLGYPQLRRYRWLPFSFAAFMASCSITYIYPVSAAFKVICAAASVVTALYLGAKVVGLLTDVSNRVRMEKERERQEEVLRKSQRFLEETGKLAGVGGWEVDLITGHVLWMPETYRLLGADLAFQPTLEAALDLYTEESKPAITEAIRQSTADGAGWDLELSLKTMDGRLIWARVVGRVEFTDGKPTSLFGAFQDITHRREEREALRWANQRAELATSSGGIGIWDWNLERNTLICDDQMYRMVHMDPEDNKADNKETDFAFWSRFVHPDDGPRIEQELRDGINGSKPYETEYRIQLEDGPHLIRATGQVSRDRNGRPTRMVGTNVDITARVAEQKKAEEALRQSAEKEQLLIHGVKDYAIIMLDPEGRVSTWNEGAAQIKGYNSEEIIGRHLSVFHTPEDKAAGKTERALEAARREGRFEDTGWRVRKDGSLFWANVVVTALFDAEGNLRGYGKVTRDITERKRAEEATEQARSAADQANRAKSEFLANMSHEVRTPVNAIMGMAHLGLRADPAPRQREYLTKIDTAAKRLLSIMNDILDFSKIEAGKLTLERIQFALHEVLENLRDIVEQKAREKQLALVFSVAPDIPAYLSGDPLRLGQVLINLVNNAVKFTDHGEVRVAVARVDDSGSGAMWRADSLTLRFSVADTGIGMTALQRENLFLAFHQADSSFTRQYGGTGLGLAITKQLVELMGGSIGIESKFGVGSTFSFTVQFGHAEHIAFKPTFKPQKDHDSSLDPAGTGFPLKQTNGDAGVLSGRHVLLVEDNDLNRDLATELLADLGLEVTVAVDGQAAVDAVQCSHFDLVLMDIQMPVLDGLAATRKIRSDARFHNLPIIAMTAHAMGGDYERSLASGMNDHVTKPIDPAALTRSLIRWMPPRPSEAPAGLLKGSMGSVPEHLPPFNIAAALLRTNNKPLLLRKLLLGFRQQYAGAVAELKALLSGEQWAEAQRLVHSLKSIAGTLETAPLAAAAGAVETALRNGERSGLEPLIDDLAVKLQPAIDAVAVLDGSAPAALHAATNGLRRAVILAVDDQSPTLDLLADTFGGEYEVVTAGEGREAISLAQLRSPELVILDIDMPGMNGFEVCSRLKEDPLTRDIPIIFLTGRNDAESETRGLTLGAVDYVSKPLNPGVMKIRVQNQSRLKRAQIELFRVLARRILDDMVNELESSLVKARIYEIECQMKEGFLSHVSHELRSPLATIYSFVSIVADRLAGDINPQQDEYLKKALDNVDELKNMVNNLLDATRLQTEQLEVLRARVDMNDTVRIAFDEMQGIADSKQVHLCQFVAEDIGPVVVDPIRVREALLILLENAVKFTPAEGTVSVSVSRTNSKLLMEIADTGCGISPDLTDSIFDKLRHVEASDSRGRVGLGLGLHIARELIRRQGGEIWVESVLGQGSKFSFTVAVEEESPVTVLADVDAADQPQPSPCHPGRSEAERRDPQFVQGGKS